jgi:hypothetical protein
MTESYLHGYLLGYMHKRAEEVTVNKDSVFERNPEMEDNRDKYPKYPERKEWEQKLIRLRRKLNFDKKPNALEDSNGLPHMQAECTGAGTEGNKAA